MNTDDIFNVHKAKQDEARRQAGATLDADRDAARTRDEEAKKLGVETEKAAFAILAHLGRGEIAKVKAHGYDVQHHVAKFTTLSSPGTMVTGLDLYMGKQVVHRLGDANVPYNAPYRLRFSPSVDPRGFVASSEPGDQLGTVTFPLDLAQVDGVFQMFVQQSLAREPTPGATARRY